MLTKLQSNYYPGLTCNNHQWSRNFPLCQAGQRTRNSISQSKKPKRNHHK
jgi:hypothetical protein